jgi:hypothetical protein
VSLAWVKSRRARASVAQPRAVCGVRSRRTPTIILLVLLAWVSVAGAFAAWKVGPLATEPASERDWIALAVACAVIATLIVLLFEERRRTATNHGDGSTGSR